MEKAGGKAVLKKAGALGVALVLCLGLFAGFATEAFASENAMIAISEYEIKNNGGEIPNQIKKNDVINVTLTVIDERLDERVIAIDDIVARLNTESFVFALNGGLTVNNLNLVEKSYAIVFTKLKYTGKGNTLTCDVNIQGSAMETVTLTLNQCVEGSGSTPAPSPDLTPEPTPEPESESSSSESIVKGTGFVLKSINFGGGSVDAGNNFNLDATLLSTNGSYSVENVSVEVTPPKEFSIAAGSSVIYVGTVKPNQNIPITVPMQASAIAEEGSYAVTLTVGGVNAKDGTPATAEMTITIPITQPDRFEMTNVQVPDFLMANMDDGSGFSNITLVNKGKNIIYNVSVSVEGEGLTTDMGTIFVGNINPGSESGADFNILAAMPGTVDAMVLVTYENAKGEENSLTHNFTIDVQDGGDMGGDWSEGEYPEPMPEESAGGGPPWWLWVILACAVAVGITVFVVVRKNNKAKKEAALLDEDDEDDGEDA